jgi:hypothetical protein
MTSSMTSHATIGNSTFARPRSAGSTMSSIDGPSDFTENMFGYMKGNKQATTKKASRVKPKAKSAPKPAPKRHLKQEESGIIIESPSEFSDDLTEYMIDKKDMSSPKSDKSDPDGPFDFTANIAGYMGGIESYSPSNLTGVIDARAAISSTPMHKDSISQMSGTKAQSPAIPFNLVHEKAVVRDSQATLIPEPIPPTRDLDADLDYVPNLNKNLVINGPSNFASLSAFINGTHARHASVHTTSSPKVTVRPMSSPAKGENFDEKGRADFAADLAEYINEKRKEATPTAHISIINTQSTKPALVIQEGTSEAKDNGQEAELRSQIAQLQAQLLQRDDTITELQNSLSIAENKCVILESNLEEKNTTINKWQTSLNQSNQKCQALEQKLLLETVEPAQPPQSEQDCKLLEAALSHYADNLKTQHHISETLATKNEELKATISSLQERQEKREEEWQVRVALLLQEVERRGAACMELWGQLEHPGERDAWGRQKYTYKYTRKGTRGA